MIKFPPFLRTGSTIAITAPSYGVGREAHARLDNSIKNLNALGFNVIEGLCLRKNDKWGSGSPKDRAQEFMEFYRCENVDAIFPPWGGSGILDILPLLNLKSISQCKPKWVMGYSDISALLLSLTVQLGVATAHGPNLMEIIPEETDPYYRGVFEIMKGERVPFVQVSSEYQLRSCSYQDSPYTPFEQIPGGPWQMAGNEDVSTFSGRLLGGCLDILGFLVGTRFADIPTFRETFARDGVVLFLENANLHPTQIAGTLFNMRHAGWFDNCKGIIFGRDGAPGGISKAFTHNEVVRRSISDLGIPIILNADVGHKPPQMTLINGGWATVDVKGGHGTILQSYK